MSSIETAQSLAYISHQVAPLAQCDGLLMFGGCCADKVSAIMSPKPNVASVTTDKKARDLEKYRWF